MRFEPELIHGDFFETYHNFNARSVDLFLADPPYGLFTEDKSLTGVNDPVINIDLFNAALDYLVTATGTVLLFCNLDLLSRLRERLTEFEFRWEYTAFKNNGTPAGSTRPLHNVEYIGVWKRKSSKATDLSFNPYESGVVKEPYSKLNVNKEHSTRNMTKRDVDSNEDGRRYIKQSLNMTAKCNLPTDERTNHPFQKPEKLLRTLIRVHSNEEALVMDGFAGSGSTLAAAYKEGRRAIGFENDKRWFDEAQQRLNNLQNGGYDEE